MADEENEYRRLVAQEELTVDILEHIAEAMEIRGVSKAELASRCGVGRSAMTQRLSGASSMTLRTLSDTLFALGFSLDVGIFDEIGELGTIRQRDREAERRHRQDALISQCGNVLPHPIYGARPIDWSVTDDEEEERETSVSNTAWG